MSRTKRDIGHRMSRSAIYVTDVLLYSPLSPFPRSIRHSWPAPRTPRRKLTSLSSPQLRYLISMPSERLGACNGRQLALNRRNRERMTEMEEGKNEADGRERQKDKIEKQSVANKYERDAEKDYQTYYGGGVASGDIPGRLVCSEEESRINEISIVTLYTREISRRGRSI